VLAADCAPFAYAGFHQDFLSGHAVVIGCPKLDDLESYRQKLVQILHRARVNSLTVVHMEVPCCFGLVHIAKQVVAACGRDIPFKEVVVGIKGGVS
ncbi:4Fe-4S ferredoxin, partial [Chloroflexota bacterium]